MQGYYLLPVRFADGALRFVHRSRIEAKFFRPIAAIFAAIDAQRVTTFADGDFAGLPRVQA